MKKVWLVIVRDVARVYKALAPAKEAYQEGIKDHWDECIKYSCPAGVWFDDNYQTLKQCLNGNHATINKHIYSIKGVTMED